MNVYVSVRRTVVSFLGTPYSEGVSGARVEALVGNPSNIGTISPQRNTTGWDIDNAGTAKFVFTAKEIGETAVGFTGKIDHRWFGTNLVDRRDIVEGGFAAKVIPCKFEVKTVSRFIGAVNDTVANSDAKVMADGQGNFRGSATVNYATTITDSSCSFSASDTPSQVDWTGTIDIDQLVLTGTFQPSMTSFSASCPAPAPGYSNQKQWTLDPLTIRIALSDGASVSTKAQGTTGVSGSAVIIVIPEECSGTATC